MFILLCLFKRTNQVNITGKVGKIYNLGVLFGLLLGLGVTTRIESGNNKGEEYMPPTLREMIIIKRHAASL